MYTIKDYVLSTASCSTVAIFHSTPFCHFR